VNLPGSRVFFSSLGIVTDDRDYLVDVDRWKAGGRTEKFLAKQPEKIGKPDDCGTIGLAYGELPCRGFSGALYPTHDYVHVTVPQACLGDPRIRVH
jgi:hypothetical protein